MLHDPVLWCAHSEGAGTRVEKIRVLLANYPVMLPDEVRKLVEGQPGMEIVGDLRGPMRILQEVGRTKADAVILMQDGLEEPGLCSQLLAVYPDVTILGVASDMRAAFIQQLCPRRRDIIDPQNENIAESLRAAVREPWTEY